MLETISGAESEYIINGIITLLAAGNTKNIIITREKFSGHTFVQPTLPLDKGILAEHIINVLEYLSRSGYLNKSESSSTYCVKCFNTDLLLLGRCPSCNSSNIRAGKELVHSCGYSGFETMFVSKMGLVCPACKMILKEDGSDYKTSGLIYRCATCYKLFTSYKVDYYCSSCGTTYPKGEEPSLEVVNYEPTEKFWSNSPGLLAAYRLRDLLAEKLETSGFKIIRNFYHQTKSESIFLDILAQAKDVKVGIKVCPLPVNEEAVLVDNLSTAKNLAGISDMIAILQDNLSQSAMARLAKAGIIVLRPSINTAEMVSELIDINRSKRATFAREKKSQS